MHRMAKTTWDTVRLAFSRFERRAERARTATDTEWGDSPGKTQSLAPIQRSHVLWLPIALVLISQVPIYVRFGYMGTGIGFLTLGFRTSSRTC